MTNRPRKQTVDDIKRITLDAVMVALYFALSLLAIQIGGLKLTFEHLPIILCAVIAGPVDAVMVGGLGELINQLLSFGLTPTTLLWMAPAIFRGLSMGLCAKYFSKELGLNALLEKKFPWQFALLCVASGMVGSAINTGAYYVDSKMFGYYNYYAVFGVFWIRLIASAVSSVVMAVAVKPIAVALRKNRII